MKIKKLNFTQNIYSNTLKIAEINGLPKSIYYSISNNKIPEKYVASFVTDFGTAESLGEYDSFDQAAQSCQSHFEKLIESNLQ